MTESWEDNTKTHFFTSYAKGNVPDFLDEHDVNGLRIFSNAILAVECFLKVSMQSLRPAYV